MRSGIVLSAEDTNGVVFNAKGDFAVDPGFLAQDYNAGGGQSGVDIRFKADGTVELNGLQQTNPPSGQGIWVDTNSNDPTWNPTGLYYSIYWTYTQVGVGTPDPGTNRTFANRLPLNATFTFADETTTGNQTSQSLIDVFIYNEITLVTATFSIDLEAITDP